MAYRRAPALDELVDEINAAWPDRQKGTDGWISDAAHGSTSKHRPENSYDGETVRAQDITQSAPYLDTNWLADRIADNILAGIETRVAGIGSWNVETQSERWFACRGGVWSWIDQDLHGASHIGHMHLELVNTPEACEDRSSWHLTEPTPIPEDDDMPKLVQRKDPDANGRRPIAVTDGIFRNDLGPTELAAVRQVWPSLGDPVVIASAAFDALVLNSKIG